jgi:hypothetical protein
VFCLSRRQHAAATHTVGHTSVLDGPKTLTLHSYYGLDTGHLIPELTVFEEIMTRIF